MENSYKFFSVYRNKIFNATDINNGYAQLSNIVKQETISNLKISSNDIKETQKILDEIKQNFKDIDSTLFAQNFAINLQKNLKKSFSLEKLPEEFLKDDKINITPVKAFDTLINVDLKDKQLKKENFVNYVHNINKFHTYLEKKAGKMIGDSSEPAIFDLINTLKKGSIKKATPSGTTKTKRKSFSSIMNIMGKDDGIVTININNNEIEIKAGLKVKLSKSDISYQSGSDYNISLYANQFPYMLQVFLNPYYNSIKNNKEISPILALFFADIAVGGAKEDRTLYHYLIDENLNIHSNFLYDLFLNLSTGAKGTYLKSKHSYLNTNAEINYSFKKEAERKNLLEYTLPEIYSDKKITKSLEARKKILGFSLSVLNSLKMEQYRIISGINVYGKLNYSDQK